MRSYAPWIDPTMASRQSLERLKPRELQQLLPDNDDMTKETDGPKNDDDMMKDIDFLLLVEQIIVVCIVVRIPRELLRFAVGREEARCCGEEGSEAPSPISRRMISCIADSTCGLSATFTGADSLVAGGDWSQDA